MSPSRRTLFATVAGLGILLLIDLLLLIRTVSRARQSGHIMTAVLLMLLALYLAGMLALLAARRGRIGARTLFSAHIVLLIMWVTLEAGLRIGLRVARPEVAAGDYRLGFSYYRGKDWAPGLFEEEKAIRHDQVPFYQWRPRPHAGRYVNVDQDGFRATWESPTTPGEDSRPLIYMFGGSTLWGEGSRDDYTIPSQVARILGERAIRVRVRNAGCSGYTFTQSLMRLIALLRDGHRPNFVLFYEGANDVFYAVRANRPGALYIEPSQTGGDLTRGLNDLLTDTERWIRDRSYVLRSTASILGSKLSFDLRKEDDFPGLSPDLAQKIVGYFAESESLLDSLSRAFGFGYLCFWQPQIFTERRVVKEEMAGMGFSRDEPPYTRSSLERVYREADELTRHLAQPRFHNITDVFADRREAYYVDGVHVTEAANRVAAGRIVELFVKEYGDSLRSR